MKFSRSVAVSATISPSAAIHSLPTRFPPLPLGLKVIFLEIAEGEFAFVATKQAPIILMSEHASENSATRSARLIHYTATFPAALSYPTLTHPPPFTHPHHP